MFTVKGNCRSSPFITGPDVILNMPYVHNWPLFTEGPIFMKQKGADSDGGANWFRPAGFRYDVALQW